MFLTLLVKILFALSPSAQAHCPHAFTYKDQNLCADLRWEMAEVIQGEELMSPVLNVGNPLPFQTYLSSVWVQIWEAGDSSHTLLFPEGLEPKPYMTMLNGMHHDAFANVEVDTDRGILLSRMKLDMMEGCWYITLKGEDLFEMIQIDSYTNLSAEENFQQELYCSVCSSDLPRPDDGGHDGHHGHHHNH
jgi:hypothetical protein